MKKIMLLMLAVLVIGLVSAAPSLRSIDCQGDGCGGDTDWINPGQDNCPGLFNPSQRDSDGDGVGDACDEVYPGHEFYDDGDGIPNDDVDFDNCPRDYNPSQRDTDGDKLGDACDLDTTDVDWDGTPDNTDNCKWTYNPGQHDTDGDGWGDQCDCYNKNRIVRFIYNFLGGFGWPECPWPG